MIWRAKWICDLFSSGITDHNSVLSFSSSFFFVILKWSLYLMYGMILEDTKYSTGVVETKVHRGLLPTNASGDGCGGDLHLEEAHNGRSHRTPWSGARVLRERVVKITTMIEIPGISIVNVHRNRTRLWPWIGVVGLANNRDDPCCHDRGGAGAPEHLAGWGHFSAGGGQYLDQQSTSHPREPSFCLQPPSSDDHVLRPKKETESRRVLM